MARNRRQTRANRGNNKDSEVRHSYTGPKSPAKIRPGAKIQPAPETKPEIKPEKQPESSKPKSSKPESPKSEN